MNLTDEYRAHKDAMVALATSQDEVIAAIAARSLACITLLESGWREGDPDPFGGDDGPGGGEVIHLFKHLKVAA